MKALEVEIGPGVVEFWYDRFPDEKTLVRQRVYELRQFARLRNRRELGWARLRVTEGPVADERDRWSELKSLDDMNTALLLADGFGSRLAAAFAYQCAKLAFRRKQRQAGVGRCS